MHVVKSLSLLEKLQGGVHFSSISLFLYLSLPLSYLNGLSVPHLALSILIFPLRLSLVASPLSSVQQLHVAAL